MELASISARGYGCSWTKVGQSYGTTVGPRVQAPTRFSLCQKRFRLILRLPILAISRVGSASSVGLLDAGKHEFMLSGLRVILQHSSDFSSKGNICI